MRIAVFGGAFNPPHLGHRLSALAAKEALGADKLLVIPTGQSPHKEKPQGSPEDLERLELTRLTFAGCPDTEVLDLEIRRQGKSYTVDTLEELKRIYPDADFFLLMGEDMLLCFDSLWYGFERILSMAVPAVFSRGEKPLSLIDNKCQELLDKYGAETVFVPTKAMPVSSTELRALLPQRQGSQFFEPETYGRIIKLRHYGAKPELDWLAGQVELFLEDERIPHVMGCRQTAEHLARRWGADPGDAAEAALLHDITKKQKGPKQLKLCEKYGILIDNDEKSNYKLLHSKTGAALAGELFGSDSAVCSAIYWHTTGKADMSLLEKIIYMADYIEPNRDFSGVEELRDLAEKDLDEALASGLEMSINNLKSKGISPHKNSQEALNWLLEHKRR